MTIRPTHPTHLRVGKITALLLQKLGIPCVDKVRKPRNGIRPSVNELSESKFGGSKRQAEADVDFGKDASAEQATMAKLSRPSGASSDVYTAALRATLQLEQKHAVDSSLVSVPEVAAPAQVPGVWGGTFARWAEASDTPAAQSALGADTVKQLPVHDGHGVFIAQLASASAAQRAPTLQSDSSSELGDLMPSSLWKLFRRNGAAAVAPVQHWSTSSVDTARDEAVSQADAPQGTFNAASSSVSIAAGVQHKQHPASQSGSGASTGSVSQSQAGSVRGWDVGSIASRSAAAATGDDAAAPSGITMPGWTLASTLPLPAGTSAHSMLRPRDDDSMEMRAAVARCSVPCFRMTFDHQVGSLSPQDLATASVTDTVMRWIKGAKPQSTFANLEASEMLGLSQADFAACGAGNGNCACATPMTLMHPSSVKKMLQEVHGIQTNMVRVLSGATSAEDVDKAAFPPKLLSLCGGNGAGADGAAPSRCSLKAAPLTACPTELAVSNGPMVRAPPGGLAHGKAASFTPLDCVTYVGLEWWLPPGWTQDTMRRTVREGLTAGKVAQEWPRLRSVTCYILESKQSLPSTAVSPAAGADSESGAVSVQTDCDSIQSVPAAAAATASSSFGGTVSGGLANSGGACDSAPGDAPVVQGDDVRAMGDALLSELLHAQPGCFEGCWPASTGALAAVLTAYMKSLFVLSRAAGEAVMDL